jgi:hypothetical protein
MTHDDFACERQSIHRSLAIYFDLKITAFYQLGSIAATSRPVKRPCDRLLTWRLSLVILLTIRVSNEPPGGEAQCPDKQF